MCGILLAGDKELMELSVDKENVDRQLREEHCKVLNLINEKGIGYFKYRIQKYVLSFLLLQIED